MSKLFRRGDIWYCNVYEAGVRIQKSTRCTDKIAAEKVRAQYERDAADPDHARARTASLTDALNLLISTREEQVKAGRRAASTVEFYRAKAGIWIRLLEVDGETRRAYPLAQLRPHVIDGYISTRRREGAGDNSISKELATLGTALKLAKRAGLWTGDSAELFPVRFSPEYVPRQRWLPPQEVAALMGQLLPRRAAIVAFIVATSASWSEAIGALREDVDLVAGHVLLRGTKRPTRWRHVPIHAPWQRTLLTYATEHASGAEKQMFAPWSTSGKAIVVACKRAKIAPCSPNDLRRTFAHWMRADGIALELVAPMMGHATTRMVEKVYGRMGIEELAKRLHLCTTGASASPQTGALIAPIGPGSTHETSGIEADAAPLRSPMGYAFLATISQNKRKLGPNRGHFVKGGARVHQRDRRGEPED